MASELERIRRSAKKASDEIDRDWPEWKKRLSDPVIIRVPLPRQSPGPGCDKGQSGEGASNDSR